VRDELRLMVEREEIVHVHFAEDASGEGRGIRGGVVIDQKKQFLTGFGDFSGGEQF